MKLMRIALAILLILSLTTQVFAESKNIDFSDIKGHWAEEYIGDFITNGIIKGYPDGTFKPERNISRAEFASLMFRLLGLKILPDGKESVQIKELKGTWAKGYLEALVDNGIIDITEYPDGYDANGAITRIEIAKMIIRSIGKDREAKNLKSSTGFIDDKTIMVSDKGYVSLAKRYEIISGYEDGTFKPDNPATRAETVKMLVKRDAAVDLIKKENKDSSYPKAQIEFKLPEHTHSDKIVAFDWTAKNVKSLSWFLEKENENSIMDSVDMEHYADLKTEGNTGEIQFKDKGTYALVASAINAGNKKSSYSQTVDVYPVMDIQFGLLKTAYVDTEVNVNVSTIEVDDSPIVWTLEKDGQGETLQDYIEGSLNNNGGNIRFLKEGNYTLIASVTDAVGRTFEHRDNIKVYHLITTEFDLPETAHTDDTLDILVHESGLGSLDIEWSLEKEGQSVNYSDFIEGSLSKDGGKIRFIDKGEYILTATVTDETGREFKQQDSIKVYPLVETSFNIPDNVHTDEEVEVTVNAKELGSLNIEWSLTKDDQPVVLADYIYGTLDNNGGVVKFKEKGDYVLKAAVIDDLGRAFEYSERIKAFPVVEITLDIPSATHTDEPFEVSVSNKNLGVLNIQWTLEKDGQQVAINEYLDDDLSNSGGQIRITKKGEYELISKVTDELGRTFENRKHIKVYPVMSISFELPEYVHTDTNIEVVVNTSEIGDSVIAWNLEKDEQPVKFSDYIDGSLSNTGGTIRFLDKGEFKIVASARNEMDRQFIFSDDTTAYPVANFEIQLPANAHIGEEIPVTIISNNTENMNLQWKLKKDNQYVDIPTYVTGNLTNESEISFSNIGDYVLEAYLTDSTSRTFVNTSSIKILNSAPTTPTISADVTRQISNGKFLVNINVNSIDPDGDIVTYEYQGKASDNYYIAGTHTVKVRAKDQYGAYSNWSNVQFNVINNAPLTPIITRIPNTNSVTPGTSIKITALSSDPDGDLFNYVWEGRPSENSTYPLGKNVVKVKAVDKAGAESPWAAIVFFVADAENGGGMTLTGPNSTIIEDGIEGATITEYTFNVPEVNGHRGNDYGRIKGYNIQTKQWEQIDYKTTKNGIYMEGTLPTGKYSKLEFYYYTNHTCMYNKSNITYTVKYHFE